jgi:hypothetical protein
LLKIFIEKDDSTDKNLALISMVNILGYYAGCTKDFFMESENNTLMFQVEIFINYPLLETDRELPLKGALDIVRLNHKDRTVQIIDFKSSYSAFGFVQRDCHATATCA